MTDMVPDQSIKIAAKVRAEGRGLCQWATADVSLAPVDGRHAHDL